MNDASLLADLRSIDWRFLLPDVNPRRVAIVAPHEDAWADEAERGFAAAGVGVDRLAPGRRSLPTGRWDVVVANAPDAVERANWLGPACLVVRAPAAVAARPRSARSLQRAAHHRAGAIHRLTVIEWPPGAPTTELMPVVGASAGRYLVRRRAGWPGRAAARLLSALTPVTMPVLRSVSVLSRAPSSEPLLQVIDPPVQHWLLVTPRFAASRHVVLLAGSDPSTPSSVAKIARLPSDRSVAHEASLLGALPIANGIAFPTVIRQTSVGEHPALIETWLDGEPLDPRRVRERPEHYATQVAAWLRTLISSPEPLAGPRWAALVDEPLERLARLAEATELSAAGGLVDSVDHALSGLRGVTLPGAIEHGDLAHPNILVARSERIGVVDWERGRPDGLALLDLIFFLSWAAGAVAGARTAAEVAAAASSQLMRGNGRLRQLLLSEANRVGVGGNTLDRLTVLVWLTQLVWTVAAGPSAAKPSAREARLTWDHRHRLLLEAAVRSVHD